MIDTSAPPKPYAPGEGLQDGERRRLMRVFTNTRIRNATCAVAGILALVVGYLPMARVPVIADDLSALFSTYDRAHGTAWGALRYGAEQGTRAGHFNPVGQALGALYHFLAWWVSAALGISPQYYHVATTLILMWAAVTGAAAVLVWGLGRGRGRLSYWPTLGVLCCVTAATLQVHAPWSNDPVVAFAPAGWGSTALGLWFVAWVLRASAPGARGWRAPLVACLLGIFCVWYYEMLTAAIVSGAVVIVLRAGLAPRGARELRRCAVLLTTSVLIPCVLFLVGRHLTQGAGSYGGTEVAVGPAAVRTWAVGMAGALPGGGWRYISAVAGTPSVRLPTVLVAGVVCLLLLGTGFLWLRSLRDVRSEDVVDVPRRDVRAGITVVSALVTLWAAATATQAVSVQYTAQIQHPGQVYLFYATAVVCVAALLVLGVAALSPRWRGVLLGVLAPVAGVFVVVQVASNTTDVDTLLRVWPHNGPLVALSTDASAPLAQRCGALERFLDAGWPPAYSRPIARDLNEAYRARYGHPFCAALPGAGSK